MMHLLVFEKNVYSSSRSRGNYMTASMAKRCYIYDRHLPIPLSFVVTVLFFTKICSDNVTHACRSRRHSSLCQRNRLYTSQPHISETKIPYRTNVYSANCSCRFQGAVLVVLLPPSLMYHSQCHQLIAYLCAVFEVLYYLRSIIASSTASPSSPLSAFVCPAASNNLPAPPFLIKPTPIFLLGVLAVLLGAYIRLDCFKTLGPLFTFDLTVQPDHQLVTRRFYAYVRHPAYTGSMLLVVGLALSHLTRGSWLTECGPLAWTRGTQPTRGGLGIGGETLRIAVWASWWLWTFCVGISRADAEDRQMRKLFNEKWDAYAQQVPWWFLPGLI